MLRRYFHGSRTRHAPGDSITPADGAHVLLTPTIDEAVWSAELAESDAPARVYVVEPLGEIARLANLPDHVAPAHPAMSWLSRAPVRVVREVDEWVHYHGTRAQLRLGDSIGPGHLANFGSSPRIANYVYFARTLDAATWARSWPRGKGAGASTSSSRRGRSRTIRT